MKGIIEAVNELGMILKNHKDVIRFKDEEIESLKNEVIKLESLIQFYNHDITEDEYTELVNKFSASNSRKGVI